MKYEPLTHWLRTTSESSITLRFEEFDRLVGGLPESARTRRPWWGNTTSRRQVHASAWLAAGWVVDCVDLGEQTVSCVPGLPELRPQSPAFSGPDGVAQLAEVLRRARFASTLEAAAAHTTMLHPSVVAQAGEGADFATVRRDPRRAETVGSFGEVEGRPVMLYDNLSAIAASFGLRATGGGEACSSTIPGRPVATGRPTPPSGTCA